MLDFIWRHIILPTLGVLIEWVPWWAWLIVIAAAIGFGWKWAIKFYSVFGWQGVLTVAIAILTLGAYRQGWLDHKTATITGIPKDDPLFDLKPTKPTKVKPKGKRHWDDVKNEWVNN